MSIQSSVNDFVSLTSEESLETLMTAIRRFDFNIRLREMDYVQKMQTNNG